MTSGVSHGVTWLEPTVSMEKRYKLQSWSRSSFVRACAACGLNCRVGDSLRDVDTPADASGRRLANSISAWRSLNDSRKDRRRP